MTYQLQVPDVAVNKPCKN